MMNFVDDEKKKQRMMNWTTLSKPTEITVFLYALELITIIGKYLPVIFLSSASLNLFLASNSFLTGNMAFGVLNLLFATGNVIFLAQSSNTFKIQTIKNNLKFNQFDYLSQISRSSFKI